ncbi:exported protein of unknown function [Streptomyces ambofaciens ATCC 23877]|uniref:Uncharacterized protein n=1 Tax=Streptomyces ambofaciens (strain ATCC 23877 / 3486 / DSM 40053 / JCM 4204 / NBRC 12836 / NRRL B-2516) TaxID=278992 RepID=A0A0K2AQ92_STRA7|nr:exported protein of unknown function [Streptomyces ambofaciens ATCC 23877]
MPPPLPSRRTCSGTSGGSTAWLALLGGEASSNNARRHNARRFLPDHGTCQQAIAHMPERRNKNRPECSSERPGAQFNTCQ